MASIKAYLKRMEEHLKENNEGRVADFKKGATQLVKFIVSNFDKFTIYTGKSNDKTAGLCFIYTPEGESIPKALFFNDGCK